MTEVNILRVFTNKVGKFGNPVGIIFDEGRELSPEQRQAAATKLGFSESVFINSSKDADVSIYSSKREVLFAGHALVGTAWLLNKLHGNLPSYITCQGKSIKPYEERGFTWVTAELSLLPQWNYEQVATRNDVEQMTPEDASSKDHTVVWAWIDQGRGQIRARTFATDWGIPEDEANGSGCMQLANNLGYQLKIIVMHGKGSVVRAISGDGSMAAVGGDVVEDSKQTL